MVYPDIITDEILKSQEGIGDAEIEADLVDTIRDMKLKKMEIKGYENLEVALHGRPEAKMNYMRLSVARDTLKQMEDFCTFLRKLQAVRAAGRDKKG